MLDNNKGEHAVRDLGNSEDTGGAAGHSALAL